MVVSPDTVRDFAFIFALKEYLDGIRFIQDLSIIETLRSNLDQ